MKSCLKCEINPCECRVFSSDKDDHLITFGKYKGMSFKDMKENYPDYLEWAITSIPKNRIDDNLYNYIRINEDEIAEYSAKKRRRK